MGYFMSREKPCIFFVDDDSELLGPLAEKIKQATGGRCEVLSPSDIDDDDLMDADLVVVDLQLEHWPERNRQSQVGLQPVNGIALTGVLRERAKQLKTNQPTGFALITGNPGEIEGIIAARRPHVVSRLSNIEWYFEKRLTEVKDVDDLTKRVASLARAVTGLPANVSHELQLIPYLVEYLGKDATDPLFERYCEAVRRCRPPIHQLSEWSHGLAILRWLLHRILPHTTFLCGQDDLAIRLRVERNWLVREIDESGDLSTELKSYGYSGPLSEFDGPRWWRDGVEQWLWDRTSGNSASSEAIHEVIVPLANAPIVKLDVKHPVAVLKENLQRDDVPVEFEKACLIQLDDWPDYAEPAYVRKAADPEQQQLKMYVVDQDI